MDDRVMHIVKDHLQVLSDAFTFSYPTEENPRPGNPWILNPFLVDVGTTNLNLTEKSHLEELACGDLLELNFSALLSLSKFWIAVKTEYPMLHDRALSILLPFSTTYLCEKTFSAAAAMKTRYKTVLEICAAL